MLMNLPLFFYVVITHICVNEGVSMIMYCVHLS